MKVYIDPCAECGEDAKFGQVDGVWLCKVCAGFHGLGE